MDQITGTIVKFTSSWSSSGFAIVRFRNKAGEEFVAAGNLLGYQSGDLLTLYGSWTEYYNTRTGITTNQFKVESAYYDMPSDLPSLEAFLGRAVSGCGPVKAKALIRKHGVKLADYLRSKDIGKICQVSGIGPATAERITNDFNDKAGDFYIASFLCSIGVEPSWAPRIQRALGPDAVRIMQRNPYRLTEVYGIGFKKADAIALKMGWKLDSPARARAALLHALQEAANKGHCYLVRSTILKEAEMACLRKEEEEYRNVPNVTPSLLSAELDVCYEEKVLVQETANAAAGTIEMTYLPNLYQAEVRLARKLRRLLNSPTTCPYDRERLAWLCRESEKAVGIELTDEQRQAVLNAFLEPVSILTGGPGCGKTATVQVVVDVARRMGYSMALCAPTGRAAKHLSNIVDEKAYTIHMLLGYDGETGEWRKNEGNPLEAGLVICDEVSMVDVELASRVMDAVRLGTPVVIIGDKDQLPAVSPGRVLDSLISSKEVPVTRLTKIFRQAEQSLIVRNAHRLLNGKAPEFPEKTDVPTAADCFLMKPPRLPNLDEKGRQKKVKGRLLWVEDYDWIISRLVHLCKTAIPRRLSIDPVKDVQVLTPMREKGIGLERLNAALQDALNPKPEGSAGEGVGPDEVRVGSKRFRVGDRVLQHRNNYLLGVSNGDIGFITKIDPIEQLIDIDFTGKKPGDKTAEDKDVQYPFREVSEDLTLGYASTVHKAQGGESKAVVVVLLNINYIMLKRNLLYTAITRAKDLLVVMSWKSTIDEAAKQEEDEKSKRNSFLAQRLKREMVYARQQTAQAS